VGIGTIALGTCIILVAFSILFGFKNAIIQKITNFSGDLRISQISGNHSLSESPMQRNEAWEKTIRNHPYVDHLQAHVQKPGILVGDKGLAGVVIKGIGNDMPLSQINQNIILGSGHIKKSQSIILSKELAHQLKVSINQSVILYFLSQPNRPRKVQVQGIYETGLEELDKLFVLADRAWVQKMNGYTADSLGTYEVYLKPNVNLNIAANRLTSSLPPTWKLETKEELFPALFDWMMMLDRNIIIFIVLLLIVACFNLIATLWVLIMERIPMVGLLKALGSSAAQIRSIFWWNGFFILLRGLVIGNILAMGFCWLQATYHLIPLDPLNYYMNSVPIFWDWLTWVWVNLGTCGLVSIIIYIPTHFITKIDPQTAINYKN
jgi:lipoprotein-releasing system permease protein